MSGRNESRRRVVITGLGVISSIGNTIDEFWQSLVDGRTGISQNPGSSHSIPFAGFASGFRGHIDDFGDLDGTLRKSLRKALKLMNRETQMGVAAAQQAVSDSRLASAGFAPERIGVCFGAGNVSMMPEDFLAGINQCRAEDESFEFSRWGTDGLPQIAPLWLLKCLPNMPTCHIAIANDLRGPNNTVTQSEAATNLAINEAVHHIRDDEADAMIVGGTGTTLQPFNVLHSMMDDDLADESVEAACACRPFDRDRTGAVLGEGAASLVIETLASATARGATIYGEILACGSSCVVDPTLVPDQQQAITNAMHLALNRGGLTPSDIGHIHAHGMSTRRADIAESRAVRKVFGSAADTVAVIALKSYTGNAGAGSGALELVASLLSQRHQRLFPILNCDTIDDECPIVPVTRSMACRDSAFLNLSVTAHGLASCVLVSAPNSNMAEAA